MHVFAQNKEGFELPNLIVTNNAAKIVLTTTTELHKEGALLDGSAITFGHNHGSTFLRIKKTDGTFIYLCDMPEFVTNVNVLLYDFIGDGGNQLVVSYTETVYSNNQPTGTRNHLYVFDSRETPYKKVFHSTFAPIGPPFIYKNFILFKGNNAYTGKAWVYMGGRFFPVTEVDQTEY